MRLNVKLTTKVEIVDNLISLSVYIREMGRGYYYFC